MYLEDCWLNSFASPLNSINIDAAESIFYYNNYLSFFKKMNISKGRVEIYQMHDKGDLNALVNAINSFSKANTIKFSKSKFELTNYGRADIPINELKSMNV